MDVNPPHVRRVAAWLAAGTFVVLLAPAIGDANRGKTLQRLRARSAAISADRQSAVLALYALDSRLAAAREEAAAAQGDLTSVRRQRVELALQLRIAKQSVKVAQTRLGARLRLLYEQGEVDPIDVLFGAKSLDEALSTLETIDDSAALDRRVIAQLRASRSALTALDRTLREREAALTTIQGRASATAESLAAARSARAAYIGRLLRQQTATRAKLAALELVVKQAQRRAARLRATPVPAERAPTADTSTPVNRAPPAPAAPTPPPAPSPDPAPTPTPTPPEGPVTLTVVATGYSIHGQTATGLPTGWGVAAVDPSVIPLGTRITVPGYGEAVAADVGSGIRGSEIDLWFPTVPDALAWGRRTVTITLH